MRTPRPAARRPQGAKRLRVQAQKIDEAQRAEKVKAGRRMRIGFQVVILAVVATMAFVLVFPTARLYSAQQVEKARLEAALEAAKAEAEDLEAQLARWQDPAFIKAQARQRLSYIMPGETSYRVADPENAPTLPAGPPSPSVAPEQTLNQQDDAKPPWYSLMWDSTVVAGKP